MNSKLSMNVVRLASAMLLSLPLIAQAGLVVVVGAKSPASKLSADQVAQLFLAKTPSLPGAGQAFLVDQTEGSAIRDAFYNKVAGKSAAQVKALWSRLVFSGAAQPPKVVDGAAEVKRLLAANPDAIGYIDSSEVDASVKVLLSVD